MEEAEYVLLGAGAGLSAAAGITYSGKRFTENFAPFIKKYRLTNMHSSAFYPFRTQEERWVYWTKHISLNRYETGPTKLYKDLYRLVKDKKYFVITSNVESQFEKAGFPSYKVFEIEGNNGFVQDEKWFELEALYKDFVMDSVGSKIATILLRDYSNFG